MRHHYLTLCLAPVFVAAGVTLAQVEVQPGGGSIAPTIAPPTSAVSTSTAPAATMESAQNYLQNILGEKGTLGTTGPAILPASGPKLEANGMLREGQQIQMRGGQLKKDVDGNSIFVFDERQEPRYPPMGVIPSRRLERMEDVAFAEGRNGSDTNFTIDAEVTQFRGKNYLYINSNPGGIPKRAATATATASAPAAKVAFIDVPAPSTPVTVLHPETFVITGRDGRFIKDLKTGIELFTFYSDGQKMFDPPMGLIPCRMLAQLEDLSEMGNKPLRFKVSGEVTLYRGKNYLYLRTAIEVKDMNQGIGNFNPGAAAVPAQPKPVRPGG